MADHIIGCTHFGHKNIIKLADRPFVSIDEMNEKLIDNWNSVVKPGDTVYHLGDFSFKGKKNEEYEKLLNGTLIKIQGNHDPDGWGIPYLEVNVDGTRTVLMHYPIQEWNGWYRGAVHLHAHTHQKNFVSAERRGNVGADALDFKPILLREAVALLLKPSVDLTM